MLHIDQSKIVANSDALAAAHKSVFNVGVTAGKTGGKLRDAIRAGVAGIAAGGEAFKSATNELRHAYALGCLVGAGHAKNETAAIELVATFSDKDKRDAAAYQIMRNSHATFAHAMKACGYVSEDGRASNARKPGGAVNQGAPSSPPANPATAEPQAKPVEAQEIKFNRTYNGAARMNAMAAELAKGLNASPKSFDGGYFALATAFINGLKALEADRAAK